MPRPLIHVGLHKTGTTWLQRHGLTGANVVRRARPQRDGVAPVQPRPGRFDAARARLAEEAAPAEERGLRLCLARERLSGNPHVGG